MQRHFLVAVLCFGFDFLPFEFFKEHSDLVAVFTASLKPFCSLKYFTVTMFACGDLIKWDAVSNATNLG